MGVYKINISLHKIAKQIAINTSNSLQLIDFCYHYVMFRLTDDKPIKKNVKIKECADAAGIRYYHNALNNITRAQWFVDLSKHFEQTAERAIHDAKNER